MAGSSRGAVDLLMQEIGAQADLLAVAEHEGSDGWSLLVAEDVVVHVELDGLRDCLVLWAEAGAPRPADRERWLETLLRYNSLWPTTGGLRMALEAEDGTVLQAIDLPVVGLDVQNLSTFLAGFVQTLGAWRTILQGSPDAAAMPGELRAPAPGEDPRQSFIRG